MLLKGLTDVSIAPDPNEAAAMAVLRLIHAADLPDPAALVERLSGSAAATPAAAASKSEALASPSAQLPPDFRSLITLVDESKALLAHQLHDQVGLVRYAPPELVVKPLKPLGADWPRELATVLKTLTGTSWNIVISDETAEPSLLEQEKMAEEQVRSEVLQDPAVRAVLDAFPEAELESYTMKGA
jgi:DNA polymerase-3 subunit gamma/tau